MRMLRIFASPLVLGAVLLGAEGVAAQPRVITGRVTDAASHAALAGASISAVGGAGDVVSSDSGFFTLSAPPAARAHLIVQLDGYDSRAITLNITGDTTRVEVLLTRTDGAQPVAAVPAAPAPATGSTGPTRTDDFDQRAKGGAGFFITRDVIEKRAPQRTSDLMRSAPGVLVKDTLGTQLLVSSRGRVSIMRAGGRATVADCVVPIGVDGQVKPLGFSVNEIDAQAIYGIEIYGGPASIPTELGAVRNNADCGLVMVWTRTR